MSALSGRPRPLPSVRTAGTSALVAAAAAWGSVFVTIKIAARGLPVLVLTVVEVLAAVAVLAAVVGARRLGGAPGLTARPDRWLVLAGVLEPGIAYPLINAGLTRTSGTHAAVVVGLESVAVVALVSLLDRRRPTTRVLFGLVLATAGAALIGGDDGGTATVTGDLLVLAGVIAAAGYIVVAQRRCASVDTLTLTFWQFAVGGVVVVAVATVVVATGGSALLDDPTGGQVVAALVTGAVGSSLAFLLYNWALARVGTTIAGASLTLIPVFGVAFSALFLGDRTTVLTVLAGAAVIVGLVITSERAPADPEPEPVPR